MPLRTPRLLIRPYQAGDGALTAAAIAETWPQLHQWMEWAQDPETNTVENQEIRVRCMMAKFLLREELHLIAIEVATGKPVVWCGFHNLDWTAHWCDTGYWVPRSAQGRGFATEATDALLRYAFGALAMRRVGISHAAGNEASQRVVAKLGFAPEGIQRQAALLPGGRRLDRHLYARLDLAGIPQLDVQWGTSAATSEAEEAEVAAHLLSLEQQLLDPAVRAQPDIAGALLTDDFQELGSSGRSFNKEQMLHELRQQTPCTIRIADLRCALLDSNTALVTYRSQHQAEDAIHSALRSSLWVRHDGQWRMRFHQGTRA